MGEALDKGDLSKDVRKLVEQGRMTLAEGTSWTKTRHNVINCFKCDLGHLCSHKVFGVGFPKAPFLFVGEAPGAKEDLAGEPFISKSGQLLRKCMFEAGFRPGDVFLTNTVKCMPPKNRNPKKSELGHCFMHLWNQLEAIKPKVIVAVGSFALDAFIEKPKQALGTCRGDQLSAYGFKLVAVWHPAYVQRSHQALRRKELVKDLKKAFKIVYPEGRPEAND